MKTALSKVEECFYDFKKRISHTSPNIGILIVDLEIAIAALVKALEEQQ
jgi:hypothetical protein